MTRFFRLTILLMACVAAPAAYALPDKEIAGREAADAWLALVDHGKYMESWQATAPVFRDSITGKEWVEAMMKVREPLGKVESRKLKALLYTPALPDAPPGEYVVVQYETQFAGREGLAVATVVTMWVQEHSAWRVCGYYIQ